MSSCPITRMYLGKSAEELLRKDGIKSVKKVDYKINEVLDEGLPGTPNIKEAIKEVYLKVK